MTNGRRTNSNTTLDSQIKFAETVASRYSAHRSSLDTYECKAEARLALAVLMASGVAIDDLEITRAVEGRLWAESKRLAHRRRIAPEISLDGFAEGAPLNSILSLRMAQSLNPRADCGEPMAEDLADVCASALKQNCAAHPEHVDYHFKSFDNRLRVWDAREKAADIAERRKQRLLVAA